MPDRFGTLSLQDDLVKFDHRAYTLEGVRASVSPRAQADTPARIVGRLGTLRLNRKPSGTSFVLVVEGPGFSWRVPVRANKVEAANDFAELLNDAARGYALRGFGRHLTEERPVSELSGGPGAGPAPREASELDNRPELLDHAFSAVDHMSRTAARKARLVR